MVLVAVVEVEEVEAVAVSRSTSSDQLTVDARVSIYFLLRSC